MPPTADSGYWTTYEAAAQVNAALCDMLPP